MKILLTICLLLAITFTIKAQQPGFEETVTYINLIFKENKIGYFNGDSDHGDWVQGIVADKSGKIVIYDRYRIDGVRVDTLEVVMNSLNLFDISRFSVAEKHLYLKAAGDNNIGDFSGTSVPVAGRLEKALTHLHSLCTKTADPFGN